MILPILCWPDPRLMTTCAEVTVFDAALIRLRDDLLETMYAANGRGLAAPQVGVMLRAFVMDAGWKSGTPTPRFFVNPQLVTDGTGAALAVNEESCLSIPDRPVRIARPGRVRLRWQDAEGQMAHEIFEGFEAVCVQHERDHLDGILCIDHPQVSEGVAP